MHRHELPPAPDDDLVPSKRIRRPLRYAIVALSVALGLLFAAVYWYYSVYRPAAASERDRQQREIVCSLANPAVPREARIRARYECPPPAPTSSRPSSTTSPAPHRSTAGSSPGRVDGATPAARPAQTHAAEPGRARTTTPPKRETPAQGRAASPRPATRTTRTVTAAPRPAPSPTRCLVDLVVVRVC